MAVGAFRGLSRLSLSPSSALRIYKLLLLMDEYDIGGRPVVYHLSASEREELATSLAIMDTYVQVCYRHYHALRKENRASSQHEGDPPSPAAP
jgi:hypothetical protein